MAREAGKTVSRVVEAIEDDARGGQGAADQKKMMPPIEPPYCLASWSR